MGDEFKKRKKKEIKKKKKKEKKKIIYSMEYWKGTLDGVERRRG